MPMTSASLTRPPPPPPPGNRGHRGGSYEGFDWGCSAVDQLRISSLELVRPVEDHEPGAELVGTKQRHTERAVPWHTVTLNYAPHVRELGLDRDLQVAVPR